MNSDRSSNQENHNSAFAVANIAKDSQNLYTAPAPYKNSQLENEENKFLYMTAEGNKAKTEF